MSKIKQEAECAHEECGSPEWGLETQAGCGGHSCEAFEPEQDEEDIPMDGQPSIICWSSSG